MKRLLLYSTFICGVLLLGTSGQQPGSSNDPYASVTCYAPEIGGPVTFTNVSIHGLPTGAEYSYSQSNITYNWISVNQISYVISGAIVTRHYDNSNPPVEIGPPTITPCPISGVATVIIVSVLPSGSISTSGQETRSDYCFAPSEMRGVECSVYSYGLFLPHVVVETKTLGTVRSGSITGNGQIYVPLAYSDTGCTISFNTNSPYGGTCSWEGVGN